MTLSIMTLENVMPSVIYAECCIQDHYVECHYAECRYAECRFAKYHGAVLVSPVQFGCSFQPMKRLIFFH
jgi:hypothetical protein